MGPEQLKVMFTPGFGMFIAPGCNGLRGSITMGFLALLAGYLYRFRLRATVIAVVAGVLLGYLFNLVRLCSLVLFYKVALRWTVLQGHAEGADYLLGASLFFAATLLLFAAIRRLGPGGDLRLQPPTLCLGYAQAPRPSRAGSGVLAATALLVTAGAIQVVRSPVWAQESAAHADAPAPHFPAEAGAFHLQRTWRETVAGGETAFIWAEYARAGGVAPVAIGISPSLGAHDTALCHTARGETWLWRRALVLPAGDGRISFDASFFNTGGTGLLEAATVCTGAHCGQWSSGGEHFGLVWSRPGQTRPVPVLLEIEAAHPEDAAAGVSGNGLAAELAAFVKEIPVASWAEAWGQQRAAK